MSREFSASNRHLACWLVSLLGLCALLLAAAPVQASPLDRHAERPSSQASGTSYMERTVTLASAGSIEFDYFVDSEQEHDFLRLRVNGQVRFEASGANKVGRARVALGAGSQTLRVSYEKDGAGNAGRDQAWVDDLRITSGTAVVETFAFDDALLAAPSGWTPGGAVGGWKVAPHAARRGLRRSIEGAFAGYNPSGIVSSVERTISWPAGGTNNRLLLIYHVDSEEGHDFFKVFVDGVQKFSISGRERSAQIEIDVGASGNHLIRLEYAKDESVDEGLDDAQVLHLEARSAGSAFTVGGFDGFDVGAAPSGWTTGSGATAGWVIAPGSQPRIYVQPQSLASEPPVDGLGEAAYKTGTKTALRDSGDLIAKPGATRMTYASAQQAFFCLLRAEARNQTTGGEQGTVSVYLDANHLQTLQGGGCSGGQPLPGSEDRKLTISYASASGSGFDVSITQQAGNCSVTNPWRAATQSEQWPVSAALVENAQDKGFVHLELRIGLHANVVAEGLFGLGIAANSRSGAEYRLPGLDGFPLLDADVTSWESMRLESFAPTKRGPRHVVVDGTPFVPAP